MPNDRVLRICLPVPRSWPETGGVETHVRELARALTRRGHHVEVWAPESRARAADSEASEGRLAYDDAVRYRYFALPIGGNWAIPPRALLRTLSANVERFDVVHTHALHKPLAVLVAHTLRSSRVPVFVTPHYHGTGHTPLAKLAHIGYSPLAARALDHVQGVIAVSPSEKATFTSQFPRLTSRTHLIPNGIVAPDEKAMPTSIAGRMILCVGRLERYKRVDALIGALPLLPDDVRLVIVGHGPHLLALRRHAEAKGVSSRVTFTGHIADEELARLWARADLYASLSLHEAFGLTLGEALAAGVPVLASDLPAHRFVASLAIGGESRVAFLADMSASRVADSLERALNCRRASRLRVSSWSDIAAETEHLYRASVMIANRTEEIQ